MRRRAVGLVLALMLCLPSWAGGQQGKTSRVGFLLYASVPAYSARLAEDRKALADLGWVDGRNLVIEQRSAENQNDRLAELARELVRAGVNVIVAENASATRAAMQATGTKHRLPSAYPSLRFMDAGGLMAMASNQADVPRRLASYIDKLLKGAKAADLPVEQPSKFELVINAKTAKAIALTLPQSLLQRADRIIE